MIVVNFDKSTSSKLPQFRNRLENIVTILVSNLAILTDFKLVQSVNINSILFKEDVFHFDKSRLVKDEQPLNKELKEVQAMERMTVKIIDKSIFFFLLLAIFEANFNIMQINKE